MAQRKLKYSRVLLKLTGDLFGNEKGKGINFEAFNEISEKIIRICKETKVQLAIVVGGGNIFRGRERDSKSGPDSAGTLCQGGAPRAAGSACIFKGAQGAFLQSSEREEAGGS